MFSFYSLYERHGAIALVVAALAHLRAPDGDTVEIERLLSSSVNDQDQQRVSVVPQVRWAEQRELPGNALVHVVRDIVKEARAPDTVIQSTA